MVYLWHFTAPIHSESLHHHLSDLTFYFSSLKIRHLTGEPTGENMRKYVLCLLMLAVAMISSAEMIIHATDGREFKVQVDAGEIARIEFSNQKTGGKSISTPAPVATPEPSGADPARDFFGLWHRTEGGKIVEYMEIRKNKGEIEVVMDVHPKGPFKTRMIGTVVNGRMTGSGPKRKFTMTLSGKDQINYTSSDPSGNNSWSCAWIRSR